MSVDLFSIAKEFNEVFNQYFDWMAEEEGITKKEAFQKFCKMIHETTETTSAPINSDRASTTPTFDATKVKAIPKVATLKKPLKDDISSLETLMSGTQLNDPTADLMRSKNLSKKQILMIHEFLSNNPEAFLKFIRLKGDAIDAQNAQFELFLKIMDLNFLNSDMGKNLRTQILTFAFSPTRFEWIQLHDSDISAELNEELLAYEKEIKSDNIQKDIEAFQRRANGQYRQWIHIRQQGSKSIEQNGQVSNQWLLAEKKMAEKANTNTRVSFATVQIIHTTLTKGQLDVPHPGEVRQHFSSSGQALLQFPGTDGLQEKVESYGEWLDEQLKACEQGKKSVILTAAQAYQRLVSIHPFENGNGRIARLMMDFVLERCGLPPAALGKDVLDAVYTLKIKQPQAAEAFVRKIRDGVQYSHALIEKG